MSLGPSISVVIPLYNKAGDVHRALDSLLSQSYTRFEVVVVDDGSTDGSAEVVRGYIEKDARIRLIPKKNGGVSSARNKGIMEAEGDYVALLDADDIWDDTCLEELVKLSLDYPDAAMWGANYAEIVTGETIPYDQGIPSGFRGYVTDYFSTEHGDLFQSSAVLVKRDAALAAGLFDERIHISEDIDFWYRMLLNYPAAYYNKVLSYYNKDANNRAEADFFAHFEITSRIDYYIDKYVPYYEANPDFARRLGMLVSSTILRGNYYFGNRHDRECCDRIVKNLSYKNLPAKYRLIFKTPRFVGWTVYQLSLFKKMLCRKWYQLRHA